VYIEFSMLKLTITRYRYIDVDVMRRENPFIGPSLIAYMTVIMIKVENKATQTVLSRLRHLLSLAECGVATLLLYKNLDELSTADEQGDTVVHWAARLGCCRTLRPVLTPAVVSVPNLFGVTPLHVAADRGLHDEVQVPY